VGRAKKRSAGAQPGAVRDGRQWWVRDAVAYLEALQKHAMCADYWIPLDVVFGRGRDEAAALSQTLRAIMAAPGALAVIVRAAEDIGMAKNRLGGCRGG